MKRRNVDRDLTPSQWIAVAVVILVLAYALFLFVYILYNDARTYLEFLPYVTQWQFFKLIVLLGMFRMIAFPPVKD